MVNAETQSTDNNFVARLQRMREQVPHTLPIAAGKLVRGIGLTLEAVGCQMPVGSQCLVQTIDGQIEAEVVGFGDELLI